MSDIARLLARHTVDLSWQEAFYRDLHEHPELSGQEEETAAKIARKLEDFDCEVTTQIGGYGIVAVFRNGEGPTVLFRADFDALPITEETGVSFASTRVTRGADGNPTGVMHACGHDMHTTALLGACALLDAHRDSWSGTFIALFQPAEETGEGAAAMVADNLDTRIPRPDVCLGQHIMPGRAGEVQTMAGPQFAACDSIRITIPGRSAHGSMPHNAIDPTFIAAMVIIRLQGIVGREVNANDFAVISIGSLHAGTTSNIIPDSAELVLNCRFYDDSTKEGVYAAIRRVVEAECVASGSTEAPTFEFFGHGEMIDNDEGVFTTVRPVFDAVFGDESVDAVRTTVSEDFSNIPHAFDAPYFYWVVGCTPQDLWDRAVAENRVTEDVPVNHMTTFLPDYAPTIDTTTKAAAAGVLTYLAG